MILKKNLCAVNTLLNLNNIRHVDSFSPTPKSGFISLCYSSRHWAWNCAMLWKTKSFYKPTTGKKLVLKFPFFVLRTCFYLHVSSLASEATSHVSVVKQCFSKPHGPPESVWWFYPAENKRSVSGTTAFWSLRVKWQGNRKVTGEKNASLDTL